MSTVNSFSEHNYLSQLCARFTITSFANPEYPLPPTDALSNFILNILQRVNPPSSVVFTALLLLERLKTRFPTYYCSAGRRLFLAAFMIAHKVIIDNSYLNSSWHVIAGRLFTVDEINTMERDMCGDLDWDLTINVDTLTIFEYTVRRDFRALEA